MAPRTPRGWEPEGDPRGVTLEGGDGSLGISWQGGKQRPAGQLPGITARYRLCRGTRGLTGLHTPLPPPGGLQGRDEPLLGETRACGVGISSWRDFRGGLTAPDGVCQRLLAHG